ncbi:hypothetical protein N8261_00945 [Flavobacteriaceae bacterium]|nr:hypothetical protein [Flavobacteriaceae bacterium]
MKKLIFLSLLLTIGNIYSQDLNITTGTNFTEYNYTNSSGEENPNLNSSSGSFFEVSYSVPFNNTNNFKYVLGVTLNQFNATGGDFLNNYSWNTNYFGIMSGVKYKVTRPGNNIQVDFKGGFNLNKIIDGQQKINGQTFDLTQEKEFSSVGIQPFIGFEAAFFVSNYVGLTAGYSISKNLSVSNGSPEDLSFNNSRIEFGIIIEIN